MKRYTLILATLLFSVVTSVWAAPPFPWGWPPFFPPGNVARTLAELQEQVAALQLELAAETAARQAAQAAEAQARQQADAAMEAMVGALQSNSVLQLDGKLSLNTDDPARPTALFSGVNVQVINGLGITDSSNGLGNLLIGYDTERVTVNGLADSSCSDGAYLESTDCLANGGTWALSNKSGSHYLIIGDDHNYTQYAGLLVGKRNTSNRAGATVSAGTSNTASGEYASVSGGDANSARGQYASVSGGSLNVAGGMQSSISGGNVNSANSRWDTVSGGENNVAGPATSTSSICGGSYNIAQGGTICGGHENITEGSGTILGGASNTVSNDSTISGGFFNTASGNFSSVLGGYSQEATTEYQTIPALP